jgi:hypothetical protein
LLRRVSRDDAIEVDVKVPIEPKEQDPEWNPLTWRDWLPVLGSILLIAAVLVCLGRLVVT